LQCIKSWRAAGFKPPSQAAIDEAELALVDDEVAAIYEICSWDQDE
jgi:hypothetical protein